MFVATLPASLSGTFLQTLPELVTPLKEHVLFISAQLSTDAVIAIKKVGVLTRLKETASKHARKHEACPARVMNEFRLDSNGFGFI